MIEGKCLECGDSIIGVTKKHYQYKASTHILNNHRNVDPDKPIVRRLK